MNLKPNILNCRPLGRAVSPLTAAHSQVSDGAHGVTRPTGLIGNRKSEIGNGFTLVEILMVVVLLSLIVLALMAVFNSTQAAFRAGITQTDVMEGGRSVMGLIQSDLEQMTPSFGQSNSFLNIVNGIAKGGGNAGYQDSIPASNAPVNMAVVLNQYQFQSGLQPLLQSLAGSSSNRVNVLQKFFFLTRRNTTWTGVGYFVDTSSTNYFNPLYRFTMTTNVAAANAPWGLYGTFLTNSVLPVPVSATNLSLSHLVDGVVHLTVRAYDPRGYWMTNGYPFGYTNLAKNAYFAQPTPGFSEVGCYLFSNTLPAAVSIELGVLEDRAIQRAESIGNPVIQSNYLAQQAAKVHLFRQRIPIRNVDPSAYQ